MPMNGIKKSNTISNSYLSSTQTGTALHTLPHYEKAELAQVILAKCGKSRLGNPENRRGCQG